MPNQPSLSLNAWLGSVKPVGSVNLEATCAIMTIFTTATTHAVMIQQAGTKKTSIQQAGRQKDW